MVIWMLIGVGCIAICAAALIAEWKFGVDLAAIAFAPVVAIAGICILIICPLMRMSDNREIDEYIRQKAYIETHTAVNAVEDAALTSKKIELNGWLYKAQSDKTRHGAWSLYPDAVMELEPIE
ncbi:MAG: hypothetical protein KH006_04810 [Firmicutes bacterium]|jgi:hypothetical protein|nr:hypothetical protein [Bacillota bacterium]